MPKSEKHLTTNETNMHKHKIFDRFGGINYIECFGTHEQYKKPVSTFIKVGIGIALWSMLINILLIINR